MLGAPGDEIGSLRADKPTLLWLNRLERGMTI